MKRIQGIVFEFEVWRGNDGKLYGYLLLENNNKTGSIKSRIIGWIDLSEMPRELLTIAWVKGFSNSTELEFQNYGQDVFINGSRLIEKRGKK